MSIEAEESQKRPQSRVPRALRISWEKVSKRFKPIKDVSDLVGSVSRVFPIVAALAVSLWRASLGASLFIVSGYFVSICGASIVLVWTIGAAWRKEKRNLWPLLVLCGAYICLLLTWAFNRIPVDKELEQAYSGHAKKLGLPVSKAIHTRGTLASHDNAIVIWVEDDAMMYILPQDPRRPLMIRQYEPTYAVGEKWYNGKYLDGLFQPPPGKFAPWGGVARHWYNNPKAWEWVGWEEWLCNYRPDSLIEQRFDHGRMIGVLNLAPKVTDLGNIYILYDDDSWEPQPVDAPPAYCPQ